MAILRDLLLFLLLVVLLAIFYRVYPGLFSGKQSPATSTAIASTLSVAGADPVATEPMPADAAPIVEYIAVFEPTAAASDAEAESAAASTPAETPQPVAATGDFSTRFPAADTGTGALFSYQSDKLRVAIHKVQENQVTYFVADVWIRSIDTFATAFAQNEYGRGFHEMPAKIASDNAAVFAVSGDYYGARDNGIVIRNGKLYRDVVGDDVCVLRRNGTLSTCLSGEFSSLNVDDTVWQAWSFGPALVRDGQRCDTSASTIKVRNPRCGVGCYEPGHYCFIVVDGRQDGYSVGMKLDEFAQTFLNLGVTDAYNLDGGATAQMVFQGNVVNQQTKGGRAVSDILYFSEG